METLRRSRKERAENVMIVDMVRNDLGRIARVGSVEVRGSSRPRNTRPSGRSLGGRLRQHRQPRRDHGGDVPLGVDHGSAEGADDGDHRRARGRPRGIYTGTIGYAAPSGERRSTWRSARRWSTRPAESLTFGVGSGVVWDSNGEAEDDECLLKGSVLTAMAPDFELLETLAWAPEGG